MNNKIEKKLSLNKKTIARLDNVSMNQVNGGKPQTWYTLCDYTCTGEPCYTWETGEFYTCPNVTYYACP